MGGQSRRRSRRVLERGAPREHPRACGTDGDVPGPGALYTASVAS